MMKRAVLLLFISCQLGLATADSIEERTAACRAVAAEFMATLKAELMKAIREGGPVNAIEVCKNRAPEIAAQKSRATGWRVARTSLKVRNRANAPDAWERRVLESFEARRAKGEHVKDLEHGEIVTENGKRFFRYMKTIQTRGICLRCHGTNIDPAVSSALREFYPQDEATGFKLGDIRGAFTITQPISVRGSTR
jgi:hypothetical protein